MRSKYKEKAWSRARLFLLHVNRSIRIRKRINLPRLLAKRGWWDCDAIPRVALVLAFLVWVPLALAQKKENSRVMGLVELYGFTASIVYGEEDEFAANLLLEFLKPRLTEIKAIPVQGSKTRNDDLVIYVGSFDKNPLGAKKFKSLGYSLNWNSLTEGSYLLKTFRKEGKTTIFVTGKDWLGTL